MEQENLFNEQYRYIFLEEIDFAKYDNLNLVTDIIKNIRNVGIPYFKMMPDFEHIKNFYYKTNQFVDAPILVDMCYVLHKKSHLTNIFDWYDKNSKECSDWLNKKIGLPIKPTFG